MTRIFSVAKISQFETKKFIEFLSNIYSDLG